MKRSFGTMLHTCKVALLPLILFVLAGCEAPRDNQPKRLTPPFSHKIHVINEEMKCFSCHRYASASEEANMPSYKSCKKCHEGDDPAKKPNELQIKGYLLEGDKPVWSHVTKLAKEVKFFHKKHINTGINCNVCHKNIENDELITSEERIGKSECLSCHAQMSIGPQTKDNCAFCHTQISMELRPLNHDMNWKELHGRASRSMSRTSMQNCAQCHTETTCLQCHRVETPKSHNNFWRQRGHGLTADVDRSSCRTCHTDDSCVRCHQQNAPTSHRGNFASKHCGTCHMPLRSTNCITCHKDTKSHNAATRLPGNAAHVKAKPSDCRTCHFGLKMKHPDNGDDCLNCHRR